MKMHTLKAVLFFIVTAAALAVIATMQAKKLSVERSKSKLIKPLAEMEDSTERLLKEDVKTVDCARKRIRCSIRDKINGVNFTAELYNDGNPIEIPVDKMEISIAMASANVKDAAKLFYEAQRLYEKAEGEKTRLKQAKAKKNWAVVRLKAEELKAIAARLARSIIKGKPTDQWAALFDKVEGAAVRSWLSSEDKYSSDYLLDLLRDIDPSQTVNDDELPSLMNELSSQVEEACQIQEYEVGWMNLLKEEKDPNKQALLEELKLAAFEESRVEAALIHNLLKDMAYQKSFDTVENNIEMLRELINACTSHDKAE